jgi:hypothetical protein
MNNEIYEFVRSRKGSRVVVGTKGQRRRIGGELRGVVLATVMARTGGDNTQPKIVFGWSQANLKYGDYFDKDIGISIARTRALNGAPNNKKQPHDAAKIQARMETRALACFKGATL